MQHVNCTEHKKVGPASQFNPHLQIVSLFKASKYPKNSLIAGTHFNTLLKDKTYRLLHLLPKPYNEWRTLKRNKI